MSNTAAGNEAPRKYLDPENIREMSRILDKTLRARGWQRIDEDVLCPWTHPKSFGMHSPYGALLKTIEHTEELQRRTEAELRLLQDRWKTTSDEEGALGAIHSAAVDLYHALKSVEWKGEKKDGILGWLKTCPSCGGIGLYVPVAMDGPTHRPGCMLGAALKKANAT